MIGRKRRDEGFLEKRSHTKGRHEWRYRVDLTEDDRNELAVLLSAGKRSERKLTGLAVLALKLELVEALSVINELRSLQATQSGVTDLPSPARVRVN